MPHDAAQRPREQGHVGLAFQGKPTKAARPATPEDLYNQLPRTQEAVKGLWLHQGDVIRRYVQDYATAPDIALELPTGTGKTLPGLLIADWTRRDNDSRVAYVCPTNQLVRQVARTAAREGVPAVVLTGSSQDWSTDDEARYDSGQALAITNYSTIFNSSPKLAPPRLLVFDDAHAGEQFVGEQYAVHVRRYKHPDAYEQVLSALSPLLSGLLLQRLRDTDPDPGAHHQVRLLTPGLNQEVLEELDRALARLGKPHNFQFAMIRSGLASCCVYLSYGAILIRPMVPPTFDNTPFAAARQRLYLSATLGGGGELERAFGRPAITRLALPGTRQPRSGQRLFVFPELAAGRDPDGLVRRLIGLTRKAVVLTQDTTEAAQVTAAALAPPGVPVFGKADVEHSLDTFAGATAGLLGLANRYDGLDLPDDACRIVVLDGLPNAHSLQERFLSERADAGAAMAERLRTRVVQGAGRCTRGPNDFAVVILRGADLTRYLARPDVQAALDPELQAEVEFGWQNSRGLSHDDIIENVRVFLDHDAAWREGGEPALADFRRDAVSTPPPGSAALQASAALEVQAWELAYQGDWGQASALMQQAAREVGKGGDATRGYRAVLLYLAGLWLHHGATSEAEHGKARQLVRDAQAATQRGTWLRETTPLPKQEAEPLPAADQIAVAAISEQLAKGVKVDKRLAEAKQMIADLGQTEATAYERGLTTLGAFLGAEAFKPSGQGRCDSAWLWNTALWLTLEAKSEELEDKTLPLKDIRQTNTQLDHLAADRKADRTPPGSASIIVSGRLTVAPDHAMVAHPNVYLTGTDAVGDLAADAQAAWATLLTGATGQPPETLRGYVADVLRQYGCLPTQAKERLTEHPIRPLQ